MSACDIPSIRCQAVEDSERVGRLFLVIKWKLANKNRNVCKFDGSFKNVQHHNIRVSAVHLRNLEYLSLSNTLVSGASEVRMLDQGHIFWKDLMSI